jgi:hypothetical protein
VLLFSRDASLNYSPSLTAHIATVGKAMSSSEEVAYPILRKHDVDYVLVIFGGLIGYSGDDINKFLWMVRIAQGVWPDEIQEPNYFTSQGEYRVDDQASVTMKNSLMYKMSYYRWGFFPFTCGFSRYSNDVLNSVLPSSLAKTKLWIVFVTSKFQKSDRPWIISVCQLNEKSPSISPNNLSFPPRRSIHIRKLDCELLYSKLYPDWLIDFFAGTNLRSQERRPPWT